jgi:hypothetical protein
MTTHGVLRHFSRPFSAHRPAPTVASPPRRGGSSGALGAGPSAPGRDVIVIHRVGAFAVAAAIGVFGVVGLLGGLAFFDTHGRLVLGLSSNGLLAVVSLATAAVLVVAALRSGWWASTVMMVVGTLFLVSALVNLAVLDTPLNLLAFRLPNVFFSVGAGLVLLILGAYGRVSGHLPLDNPYRKPVPPPTTVLTPWRHPTRDEVAADVTLAAFYREVAAGRAGPAQRRILHELAVLDRHEDRRRRWMELQGAGTPGDCDGPER